MSAKLLTAVAVICLFVGITATAQVATPVPQQGQTDKAQEISYEKRALIKELLELTKSKEDVEGRLKATFDQMERGMLDMIRQEISRTEGFKELTPKQQEELQVKFSGDAVRMSKRLRELLGQKLDLRQFLEDLAYEFYPKYFTENELRDLISFYKSATGKKAIEVMPNLFKETLEKTNQVLMPKILEITDQLMTEESKNVEDDIDQFLNKLEKAAGERARRPPKQ
jgi:uncharacterized protein